jgi:hypothetical protein
MTTNTPISAELGKNGFVLKFDSSQSKKRLQSRLVTIKRELTVTAVVSERTPKQVRPEIRIAYEDDGLTFTMPRIAITKFVSDKEKIQNKFNSTTNAFNPILPEPRSVDLIRRVFDYSLFFEYQTAAITWLSNKENYEETIGITYLKMGTGLGKTRIGCGLIAAYGQPGLVCVPTKEIASQWIDEFKLTFPNMRVGMYSNDKPISPDTYDVLIIIINTFWTKDVDFMTGIGIVIIDEAHECYSPNKSKILATAQGARRIIGLSATPIERKDKMDTFVPLYLGTPLDCNDIPGFTTESVTYQGQVKVINYHGTKEFSSTVIGSTGMMSAIETISLLAQDPSRNKLIATEIVHLYNMHETLPVKDRNAFGLGEIDGRIRQHCILVFAELRSMLPRIRTEIESLLGDVDIEVDDDEYECPASSSSAVYSSSAAPINVILQGGSTKENSMTAKKSRIVLTTYGYSRRGVSITNMTSIVLASPRRSGTMQITGRITRQGSDRTIVRQIVDIVDSNTGLKSQLEDRVLAYKERGWTVYETHADWESYL